MQSESLLMQAMGAALRRLLRPIVRLLLKHSFPYSAFEAVAKRVFVEVAMEDFALPGKKPSISRAAILTGLTRKDVNALLAASWTSAEFSQVHHNRAARVLTAWFREAAYTCSDGSPRELQIEGPAGFAELVREHSGDIPHRAVLDELARVGSVHLTSEGTVRLVQRGFVPSDSAVHMLGVLGADVCELMETIIYNIDRGSAPARYQRKVMHTGIPVTALPKFRELSGKKSQALLEEFDAWLSAHDLSDIPEDQWSDTAKVGVGIYYYEEVSSVAGGLQ
jgi:hypothetical protein